MSSSNGRDSRWILRKHTEEKHRLLSYYLTLWSQILGARFANLLYWDCYAGRGEYLDGEPGSPRIAMDISEERFKKGNKEGRPIKMTCIFIEKEQQTYYHLRDLLRDLYPDQENDRWRIFNGDCAKVYDKLRNSEDDLICRMRIPNFFFLDPWGLNVPLATVRDMASGAFREAMIVFMVEWIHRFTSEKKQERNLKALYGIDDLTHLRKLCDEENPYRGLVDFYSERIRASDGGQIKFTTRGYEMRTDERDVPLYYVVGCSNSDFGIRKMHSSMRAVSRNEDLEYRGKFQGQASLEEFFGDPIGDIAKWLFQNIPFEAGDLDSIYTHCCERKPWARKDIREAILRLEKEGKVKVEPRPGRIRRGQTLSNHIVYFLRE
jgi:three-Cys-motif partner protein